MHGPVRHELVRVGSVQLLEWLRRLQQLQVFECVDFVRHAHALRVFFVFMDATSRTVRALGLMRVLATSIYAQVGHDLTAQAVARQHALNGQSNDTLGVLALKDVALGACFDPAWVAGVPVERALHAFCRSSGFSQR